MTEKVYARVFAEWDRRYREDPKSFESDWERALRGQTAGEYGDSAAAYFMSLLNEIVK